MAFKISRNVISLIVAVALGILTIILVNIYLSKEKARIEAEKESRLGREVEVVVAKANIPQGTRITSRMVGLGVVRESSLQPRVIGSVSDAIDKIAIADILTGEQVSATKLASGPVRPASKGQEQISISALPKKIPVGKRAFSIAIDDISAVGGMISPNDYVDIIGIFPWSEEREGKIVTQNISVTLLQNILVLAVGRQLAASVPSQEPSPRAGGGTITLALTPEQVEILNFSQELGKLRLILRPPLETTTKLLPVVSAGDLQRFIIEQAGMSLPTEPAVEEVPQSTRNVEVYRGKEKEVIQLELLK